MKRTLACWTLAVAGLFSFSPDAHAVQSIVDLNWCPNSRDCLFWSPSEGAQGYNLYRGAGGDLPAVLEGATDSCTIGSYAETTSGTFTAISPPTGGMQWYLVGATDKLGEEASGQATAGPRSIDSGGSCVPSSSLVLNEVDYDQAGTDSGEFVEIYNPGPDAQDLAGLVLILVNGGTQAEYARFQLADAAAALGPGGYLVVGAAAMEATLPAGTPFVAFGSATNNMQNGAPDGVALFDTTAGVLVDALSYEGAIEAALFDGVAAPFTLVEGERMTVSDSNSVTGALGRFPDGRDTDDAAADWFFIGVPTPGASNPIP